MLLCWLQGPPTLVRLGIVLYEFRIAMKLFRTYVLESPLVAEYHCGQLELLHLLKGYGLRGRVVDKLSKLRPHEDEEADEADREDDHGDHFVS